MRTRSTKKINARVNPPITEWTIKKSYDYVICAMLSCMIIMKMIFDFLKNIFGWADENPRKRHISDLEDTNDYVRSKKICNDYNRINHREVIEIEDDDIIICDDRTFKTINNNNSQQNDSQVRKRKSWCFNNSKLFGNSRNSSQHNPNMFSSKKHLNQRSAVNSRYSTLSKTHQLRDKEQYGQMLQNFLPSRIQIIQSTPETRRINSQKQIPVIDLENCEASTSSTGHIFSTPLLKSPSHWYSWGRRSGLREKPIEVIKLSDNDEGASAVLHEEEEARRSSGKKQLRTSREVIPVNSLRDKLSCKAVMKENFISSIAERHEAKIERSIKEAEELKKMKDVLAKRNRLQREAALEELLASSMRLSEAVLEEWDEEEEELLPELTPVMINEVQKALVPRPPDEVLVDSFGLQITRKDINTLSGLNWLNDEVINFYMNLLIQRGKEEKYPNVYAMNTFFYPKLVSSGHSALKRWTRKVDVFSQDIVVVPVHLRMHWCMSIIDFRDKSIRYYDSMGGENIKCLQALRKYLEDESMDKKKKSYDTSDWTLECMSDIPQQMNGSDCGVFSCTFAEFICANRKITFSQDDMPYFRSKMVYEILKAKLL